MGIKLIILLALLVGVLYCLHLLVMDYQALMSAPKLLRFLFKRDVNSLNNSMKLLKPNVRWKLILLHDPIQCAQYLFCNIGATTSFYTNVQKGFIYMLSLEPKQEDAISRDVFLKAYNYGKSVRNEYDCKSEYSFCPFDSTLLFELIDHILYSRRFTQQL